MKHSRNVQAMKTWKNAGAAVAAMAMAFTASSASAITYLASRAVGDAFIELSITTDDTLGVLSDQNILDWTLTLTQDDESFTLYGPGDQDNVNSSHQIIGQALTATRRQLFFDFSALTESFFTLQSPSIPSSEHLWYVFAPGSGAGEEGVIATIFADDFTSTQRIGPRAIAAIDGVVPGIPEPATWALMITGFGLAGGMLRMRRRLESSSQA
jgi:hypothetical protein